jgi:hypothetical protein
LAGHAGTRGAVLGRPVSRGRCSTSNRRRT